MVVAEKKQRGQFFTTNSDYILQGLEKFIRGKNVSDPFVGAGDLASWAQKKGAKKIVGYDIDPRYVNNKTTFLNDSLLKPKSYDFVLTNPPYLNINKASKETKEIYFSSNTLEDLYQISLASIMDSNEGIVIVPINFLSAENSEKIRNLFFSKFRIVQMNYFKHQVFSDTTYNVIAFYYKKTKGTPPFSIKTHILPDDNRISIDLCRKYCWTIGGGFTHAIKTQENTLGVNRLVEDHVESGPIEISTAYNHIDNKHPLKVSERSKNLIDSNIIMLRAIDSGTEEGKIRLENVRKYGVECLISKPSSRHMIYLTFRCPISIEEQERIIDLFNREIETKRKQYLSLFLTNYRDNDRKRVSFEFVYKMINHLYFNKINKAKLDI